MRILRMGKVPMHLLNSTLKSGRVPDSTLISAGQCSACWFWDLGRESSSLWDAALPEQYLVGRIRECTH